MVVPLPDGEVWLQFPVVAVIVLCIALLAVGAFAFTKWIWGEYKKERDKDLAWRAEQNAQREAAVAEQNKLWREAMMTRDSRWETQDEKKQAAIQDLARMMGHMTEMLTDHDAQAKTILIKADMVLDNQETILQNTKPLPRGKPKE